MVTLAIDFDNTIHDNKHPLPDRRMGPPMDGAIRALESFRNKGYIIIIHSVWADKPKVIADWLIYYKIPYDFITNIKPPADLYIDDKGVFFQNWEQTKEEVKNRIILII